jgi:hypothetical protein
MNASGCEKAPMVCFIGHTAKHKVYLSSDALNASHGPMTSVCVECRDSKHSGDVVWNTRGCACPVHASCWLERVQACIQERVSWIRCARCWSIVFVPKHKMEEDTAFGDVERPMKKRK